MTGAYSWRDRGCSLPPCLLEPSLVAESCEDQSRVDTAVQVPSKHHRHTVVTCSTSETLTSVRRTALCCDAMLPRPEQTCGSSVMLCSPSCSASLSDRFAPLKTKKKNSSEGTRVSKLSALLHQDERSKECTYTRSLLYQQLTDVLKLVHVGEPLLHQLLDSTAHSDRDDFQAAAGWNHKRAGQCDFQNRKEDTCACWAEAHQCVYFEQNHWTVKS